MEATNARVKLIWTLQIKYLFIRHHGIWLSEKARLAQSVERLALNQVVVGSSPTVGDQLFFTNKFLLYII